jgi:hypothetical protein
VPIESDVLEFIDSTRGEEEADEFGADFRRESIETPEPGWA